MRLVSNPRVFEHPLTVAAAFEQVEGWLSVPSVWIPGPSARHAELLGKLLREHGSRADLVPDAHLAAIALEHGLTVCSTDSDFARFSEVRWMDPLQWPAGAAD